MPRLNALKALEALNLSKKYHANIYRLLIQLDEPSGEYYNPDAAIVIRNLLLQLITNPAQHMTELTVAFMGIYEALLISLQSNISTFGAQKIIEEQILGSPLSNGRPSSTSAGGLYRKLPKIDIDEIIGRLLYGGPERKIYAIEDYYPSISLSDYGAYLMAISEVKKYLNDQTDQTKIDAKTDWLKRQSANTAVPEEERLLCEMLVQCFDKCRQDTDTTGGESFNRIFREVASAYGIHDDMLISKCIRTRNSAVHEGSCMYDSSVVGLMLAILLSTKAAKPMEDTSMWTGPDVENTVAAEIEKDIKGRRKSDIITAVCAVAVLAPVVYILCVFVTGMVAGTSDIQKVRWDSGNSQLDARINETIATKDTTQLLQIQRDLKWIDENIRK